MNEQHKHVFLLHRPLRAAAVVTPERRRDALHTELACARERTMQLHPLRGNPPFMATDAKRGIGAVVMNEAGEENGHMAFPETECRRRERGLEHGLIRTDEALREIEARLPDSFRSGT